MATKSKKFEKGIRVKPTDDLATLEGEIRAGDTDKKVKAYIEGAERDLVTSDQAQTLTNKTIDADSNTIQNIETDNLKSGVLNTDLTGAATDTELPSALAVKTALEAQNEAVEIVYNPADSSNTKTNVKEAIDENSTRLDVTETATTTNTTNIANHLADTVDSHDASSISNIPSGNLSATDIQSAVDELQSDVDTRALDSALTDHLNDTSDSHDASSISNIPSGNLSATDVQSALNELQSEADSKASSSDLTTHENSTSGVHGVIGNIVGDSDTQTLTSKTLTGASIETPSRSDVKQDTKANLETYALTATDGQLVFATDLKKMFQVVDNSLKEVGSGGSGGFNYVSNDKADDGFEGWALYKNTTPSSKPDDFAGSLVGAGAIFNTTTSASAVLVKDNSFELSSNGSTNMLGVGVYYQFESELGHASQPMLLDMLYHSPFSTEMEDGDIGVYLVSSSDNFTTVDSIIEPTGDRDIKQGVGQLLRKIQLEAGVKQYRLCFHVQYDGVRDISFVFDEVKFGPRPTATGSFISKWQSFTPTSNFSSGTTQNATKRQVGSSIEASYKISFTNTSNSGSFEMNAAQFGIMSDQRKDLDGQGTVVIGHGSCVNNGVARYPFQVRYLTASDTIQLMVMNATSTYVFSPSLTSDIPFSFSVGDELEFTFSYPVEGKNDILPVSEDFGSIQTNVRGEGNSGTSITSSVTPLDFISISDLDSSFDGTTFTSKRTQTISISGNALFTASAERYIAAYVDSGSGYTLVDVLSSRVVADIQKFDGTITLNSGNKLQLRSIVNGGTLSNSSNLHTLNIKSIESSQQLFGEDKLVLRAESDSGQSISNATFTTFVYEDTSTDTHGSYNSATGVYTFSESGSYELISVITIDGLADNAGRIIHRAVDGTSTTRVNCESNISQVSARQTSLLSSGVLEFNKDDTIKIEIYHDNGATRNANSFGRSNYLSIKKVK